MSPSERAPSPFAADPAPDAWPRDLILRSSDDVEFYVHKAVLVLSSETGAFRDIAVPALPASTTAATDAPPDLPVIQVKESSLVLYRLLLLCYPKRKGFITGDVLEHIHLIYRAAHSHGMEGICELLRSNLFARISDEPYRVYSLACSLGLPETARAAATETLKGPNLLLSGEYEIFEFTLVTGSYLIALNRFRTQCADAACIAVDNHGVIVNLEGEDHCWWSTKGHSRGCGAMVTGAGTDKVWRPAIWFQEHIARVRDAVRKTPCREAAATALMDYTPCFPLIGGCSLCNADAPRQLVRLANKLVPDVGAQIRFIVDHYRF
ncbi:hypothetical protein FB45DRAFT_1051444 [Roridomyces roridus]|uniref:BTB domain-containing protein n=1 Tax=Roridomyces roridus TaxID=1738132 RepID=A0AAD7CEF5_9AGAR|nr:hypothetical protein FB45DRAFT_1051444 [Roridomyces roridus]